MFGFFKKKDTQADAIQSIALYAKNFEGRLKHVENLKKIGRHDDADAEISSICGEAISLFLYKYSTVDNVKKVQYLCLLDLLKFLNIHGYTTLFAQVSKEVGGQRSRFTAPELAMLSHIMGLKINAARKSDGNTRLVFYTCQECGNLNLIVTEPCIKCGYIARNEKELRRSLLLNSKFIHPKYLIEISRRISISYHSNPRGPVLTQLWGSSDIDLDAYQKTEKMNSQIKELLEKCVSRAADAGINYSINYNCQSCRALSGVWADRLTQQCGKCNTENRIPTFKLYKAALVDSLEYIRMTCVIDDDIKLANLIAEMTMHYEYAVRRNQYPTITQRESLRQCFKGVGILYYVNNSIELKFSSGTFDWTAKSDLDEEVVEQFEYHVGSLRTLFKIMETDISL
jgi:hypothetical protein